MPKSGEPGPALARADRLTRDDGSVEGIVAHELSGAIDVTEGRLSGSREFKAKITSTETYLEFEAAGEKHWVRSAATGFASVRGKANREAITFDDVTDGVRVTQKVYEGRTKEEIVLLNERAPATFGFRLSQSDGLRVEMSGETVVFADRVSGQAALRIEPPFALDAAGKRFEYRYVLAGDLLTLEPSVPLVGVKYPLTIDPSYSVASGTLISSSARALARTSNGDLHAVYHRNSTVDNIFYAKSTDGGQTWAETNLTNDVTYSQSAPSIAVDSADRLHIVWWGTDAANPTFTQIRYMKYASGWSGITDITSDTRMQLVPAVAVDASDRVHVVWHGKSPTSPTVYQVRYASLSTAWSAPVDITTEAGNQGGVSLAVGANNDLHVAWTGFSAASPAVQQVRYMKRAGAWGTPTDLTSEAYNQYSASIALDSANKPHVVWRGPDASSPVNSQVRYATHSGTWSAPADLTSGAYDQDYPTIAIDAKDYLHVVWVGTHAGSATYRQVRHVANTGSWQAIENLTSSVTANQGPVSQAWARWPSVRSELVDRPASGYAFTWADGASLRYYGSDDLAFESQPGSGLLGYGSLTAAQVGQKYRTWVKPGSTWNIEMSGPVTGPTTYWTVVKASPANPGVYVKAMVTTEATNNFKVYTYNAGTWTLEFTRTMLAAQYESYRLFDLDFDAAGRVLVTYGQSASTTTVYSRVGTWNGSSFGLSGATENSFAFTTAIGNLRWLRLASRLNGNEMILTAVGDGTTNNINARVWDGATFGNEGGAWGLAYSSTVQDFDCAWETASGDGMVAWGFNAAPWWKYATWSGGSWTVTNGSNPGTVLGGAIRVLSLDADPRPTSNLIAAGMFEAADSDVDGAIWSGGAWASVTSIDITSYTTVTGKQVDVEYAGQTGNAVLVYDDNSTADLDWSRSVNGGAFGAPTNVVLAGGNDNSIQLTADESSDRLLFARLDSNSDIYAYEYTDATTSWATTNGGAALEADSSGAATRESYMFAYEGYPPRLGQRSYRFMNDDGATVGVNTPQAAVDTARTSVRSGERFDVRLQVDNTLSIRSAPVNLKLQYDAGDENWVDVSPTADVRPALGLSGTSGAALTGAVCAPSALTWSNGSWQEGTSSAAGPMLAANRYSELGFMLQTSAAAAGSTYRLRLYDVSRGAPLNGGVAAYPTFEVLAAAQNTLRHSKDSSATLGADAGDAAYFLDQRGYAAVATDDGTRDAIVSAGTSPVFVFNMRPDGGIPAVRLEWDGQSTTAASTNPLYLQVYDHFVGAWVTRDSDSATAAGTDLALVTQLSGSAASRYYDGATGMVTWRVYQAPGAQTLSTDRAFAEFAGIGSQRSYRFMNDDGDVPDAASPLVSADTTLTGVRRGERVSVRVQVDDVAPEWTAGTYRLQYDKNDGNWIDIDASSEIRSSAALSGANGDPLTAPVCAASANTWVDGVWHEGAGSSTETRLNPGEYTELGFTIETGAAVAGTTYRLRLSTKDGVPLDEYDSYPTLAVVAPAADTLRHSKAAVASVPSGAIDLRYFLDGAGYAAVAAPDDTRDAITSWGNTDQRLNTITAEAQKYAKAATDPNSGRTLVVRTDDRAGVFGVYGRILDADGKPSGASDIAICLNTGTDPYPTVAVDSAHHRFLVTWTDFRNGRGDIYGRFVGFDGSVLGAADIAIATSAASKQAPVVAYDRNADRFLVAWTQWGVTGYDVFARLVDDDGAPLGTGDVAVCVAAGWQYELSIAFSPADDRYLLGWTDYRSGTSYDVYGRLVNSDGTLVGASDIAISTQVEQQQKVSVACDEINGRFLVAWEDSRAGFGLYDIYARIVNADGSLFGGADTVVCSALNAQSYVSAAFDPADGRYLLAWSDGRSGTIDVYGRALNADGSLYGSGDTPICSAVNSQTQANVTYNEHAGRFLVAWEDFRDSNYDIRSRYVAPDASLAVAIPEFMFKVENRAGTPDAFTVLWDGRSSVSPATRPVHLQVYDNVGLTWATIATNSTAAADADFAFSVSLSGVTAKYYDASNRAAVRVYQEAGDQTLGTDFMAVYFGSRVAQRSYRFQNDDGSSPATVSEQAMPDTPLTGVRRGERIVTRFQIENSGASTSTAVYKLQFDRNDGVWVDVAPAAEIRPSATLSATNGSAITAPVCAASLLPWANGSWHEGTGTSGSIVVPDGGYTEIGFAVQLSAAVAGTTYRLRLFDVTAGTALPEYVAYPTLSVLAAASDTIRHSKESTAALPTTDADRKYYFDETGYTAIAADDGVREQLVAAGTIPVFSFKTKAVNNTRPIRVAWDGQSSVAPATNAVYLQVFDRMGSTWVTKASNTTATADADFTLTAELGDPGVFRYYDFTTYTTMWRVYQVAGNETLRTDYVTMRFGGFLKQTSFRLMNDDGATMSANTPQAAANVARTDVRRGERMDVRIQLENPTTVPDMSTYRLQFDRGDGVWEDMSGSTELRLASGLSGMPSEAITSSVCAANSRTWVNGTWFSGLGQTATVTYSGNSYTELGFVVETGNAVTGQDYRMRIWDVWAQRELESYTVYPAITVVDSANDLYRHSKEASGSLAPGAGDVKSFLDDRGYDAVVADDGIYDAVTAHGNGEYPMHATTTGVQKSPAVAYRTPGGAHLVVWVDSRSGNDDIYGRFVASDGRLMGAGDIAICSDATAQSSPTVAYDSTNDRYMVAWVDQRSGNADIYGRILNADGTLYGAVDLALCTNVAAQSSPSIAFDSTNARYMLVWQDSRSGDDIYYRLYTATGSTYSLENVVSSAVNAQQKPVTTFDPVNLRFLVAWQDFRSGTSMDIYARLVNAGAGLFGSEIAVSTNASTQGEVSIAFDRPSTQFLAAWQDDRAGNSDIYGRIIGAAGALPGAEFGICTDAAAQNLPAVVADTVNGRFLAIWQDYRAGTARIYDRPVTTSGALVGAGDIQVSGSSAAEENVAAGFDSGAARALVVWDDWRANPDENVYGRLVSPAGSPLVARPEYVFAVRNLNSDDAIQITWRGKTSVSAASSPVTLEIYDFGGASWTTLLTNNSAGAGVEFALNAIIPVASAPAYYDAGAQVRIRVAQPAADATLSSEQVLLEFGTMPGIPTALSQYEANGTTPIAVGAATQSGSDTPVRFTMQMTSANPTDTLTPMVEIRPLGTPFTGVPNAIGPSVPSGGSPVIGAVTVSGLAPGVSYHWQARAVGLYGAGGMNPFGGNAETAADFTCATDLAALITSPQNGSVVSGIVDIAGIAAGLEFASYELSVGKGPNPPDSQFDVFTTSSTPVLNGTLGTWDATALKNKYTLRLRVFDGLGAVRTYKIQLDVTQPATVTDDAAARATAWGNQRKVVRSSDGTLSTFYVHSSGSVVWTKSMNGGTTWSTESTLTASGDEVTAAIASNDDIHIAYHSTSGSTLGIVYRKATYSAGTWTLSGDVPLETAGVAHRNPSIVLDSNELPNVVWGKGTTAGAQEAAVYHRRATGDPAVLANWTSRNTISAVAPENMGNPSGTNYVGAALLHDPATNDLYAVFNVDSAAGQRVSINRGVYSGGTWVWSSFYESPDDCGWPPSAVLVGSNIHLVTRAGANVNYIKVPLASWNNAAGWSRYGLSSAGLARSTGSITYDSLGNLYAFYSTTSAAQGNVAYRVLRAGDAPDAWTPEVARTNNADGNAHPNVALGSPSGRVEWVWTNGNSTPYTVLYDYIGLLPQNPQALTQYAADHTSVITVGVPTIHGVVSNLHLDFLMRGNVSADTLTPRIEVRPVGVPFTGVATHSGASVAYAGTDVTGTVPVTGLSVGSSYHWQAWVEGNYGTSRMVSYGANLETDSDVSIVQGLALSIGTFNRDGSDGAGSVSFGTVSPAGSPYLVNGDADKHAVGMTVESNVTWNLSVQASGDLVSGSDTMPISRLEWRTHGSADAWTPFQSATPWSIMAAQAAVFGSTTRHDFQLDVTMDDAPGTYVTTLTYTLAAD